MLKHVVYTHPFGSIERTLELTGVKEADALIIRDALGRIHIELNMLGLTFNEGNLNVKDKTIGPVVASIKRGRPPKSAV